MRTPTQGLKIVALVAIILDGLIHLRLARVGFGNATYEGVLFVASAVGAMVAAVGVYRDRAGWGWLLGAFVAGGTLLGYVVSRTVGLPGRKAEPGIWFTPLGIASVVAELTFLVAFAIMRRPSRGPSS
jgi:hypothetical protein